MTDTNNINEQIETTPEWANSFNKICKHAERERDAFERIECERDDILRKYVLPDLKTLKITIDDLIFDTRLVNHYEDFAATLSIDLQEDNIILLKVIYTIERLYVNANLIIKGRWRGHGEQYTFPTNTPSEIMLKKNAEVLTKLINFRNHLSNY